MKSAFALVMVAVCVPLPAADVDTPGNLPGTAPLAWQDDIASRMVDGADRFLLRKLDESVAARERFWHRDFSSADAYTRSLEPNRRRLAHILGVRDKRLPVDSLRLDATTARPALLARGAGFEVHAVRWPVFRRIEGEGLLLVPDRDPPAARVIAVPDADVTPEMLVGLVPGVPPASQTARRLAENGCLVVVPALVSRERFARNGRAVLTHREYLYRPAFELGRHVIGYELQELLAVADWFASTNETATVRAPLGILGWGEGGLLALYGAALDTRFQAACVSGTFDTRQRIWQEPIDRNVFGLLEQFGDAELAALIAPRGLVVEACRGPELELPGEGGAPGRLATPRLQDVRDEAARAERLSRCPVTLVESEQGQGPCGSDAALRGFLCALGVAAPLAAPADLQQLADPPSAAERTARLVAQIDSDTQWLLEESPYVRKDYFARLDTSSLDAFRASIAPYRDHFRDEVIGAFDEPRVAVNPRTRRLGSGPGWTSYEVVLDVFPELIAYGLLLVPEAIPAGERRPVVVCQHGLEGRPQKLIEGDNPSYHDYAARLAERGFVTFAPQNPYLFGDRFRTLQRKANPLKQTLFSLIVPQHQQIVDWLTTLPFVDGRRIGFYGLSYGGKSAMRIPPLVDGYCLSICSADFNDWVWKNASTRAPYSYVWTGEYEIFEFDLGSTFNYAEMAALIAPRPFMVERGHFDAVAPDERVGYEFAKVRHLYQARLGIGDRCEIEWFAGPHTIHGEGTFRFLHRHLDWPQPVTPP